MADICTHCGKPIEQGQGTRIYSVVHGYDKPIHEDCVLPYKQSSRSHSLDLETTKVTNRRICMSHRSGHKGCPAISLKQKLIRRGYWATQYQGYISTNAPLDVVKQLEQQENPLQNLFKLTTVRCPICDKRIPVPLDATRSDTLLRHIKEAHPVNINWRISKPNPIDYSRVVIPNPMGYSRVVIPPNPIGYSRVVIPNPKSRRYNSWKLAVKVFNEPQWNYSGMRFGSKKEAEDYGVDLASRWTMVEKYEAQPAIEPVNYSFKDWQLKQVNPIGYSRVVIPNLKPLRHNVTESIDSRNPYEYLLFHKEAEQEQVPYFFCPACKKKCTALFTLAHNNEEADYHFKRPYDAENRPVVGCAKDTAMLISVKNMHILDLTRSQRK